MRMVDKYKAIKWLMFISWGLFVIASFAASSIYREWRSKYKAHYQKIIQAKEDSLADYRAMPDSILLVQGDCKFVYYMKNAAPGYFVRIKE